jgi:hypothetical protein
MDMGKLLRELALGLCGKRGLVTAWYQAEFCRFSALSWHGGEGEI